jgi:DNA-binding MarR family transcriptional regulator
MSQFNFIYAEEHLSHREKTVYIYLRDRADACWPGIKTIARELGLSPRTVQRALADLERRQLIEKQNRRRANGSLTSNLYRLTKRKTSQPPAKGGL